MSKLMIVVIAGLALAAPAAHAGTPVSFGKGGYPAVTVDAGGTTHIVWVESGFVDGDVVRYCRLTGAQRSCTNPLGLVPPPTGGLGVLRGPQVFALSDGRVIVAELRDSRGGRQSGLFVRTSSDGGATFGDPVRFPYAVSLSDSVFGPGESISGVSDGGKPVFANTPLPGGGSPEGSNGVTLSNGYTSDSGLGMVDGKPLVVWRENAIQFRRYAAAETDTASLHTAANWSPAALVDSSVPSVDPNQGGELEVAAGSSGLFLAHLDTTASGGKGVRVRAFRNGTFDEGVVISEPTRLVAGFAFSQDSGGNLHVVWQGSDGLYWRTASGGASWAAPVQITHTTNFRQARIAPLRRDFGRVFWTTSNSSDGTLFGATSMAAPCVAGDTRAACEPPRCERQRNCPPNRWRINGTRIRLQVLADGGSCVRQRARPRLRVVQGGPRSGRVRRVRFELAGSGSRTDTASPFQVSFAVAQPVPGARHRVFARARVKVGSRVSKFSMSQAFRVCDAS